MSQNNYYPSGYQPVIANQANQPQFYSGQYNPYAPIYNPGVFNQPMNFRTNQPQRQAAINGRIIGNENEVTPQEILMDGSVSLFPTADYSCIYAKSWTANGTIQTVKFIPAVETTTAATDDPFAKIDDRLNTVENLLRDMMRPKSTKSKPSATEPEVG